MHLLQTIRSSLAALLLFAALASSAQLEIKLQALPFVHRTGDLFNFRVENRSLRPTEGTVRIVVRTADGKLLLNASSGRDLFRPGANDRNSASYHYQLRFADNRLASLLAQTDQFPEGDYEACYSIEEVGDKDSPPGPSNEDCISFSVHPVLPLELVEPYNGDSICSKRPDFFWQPAFPAVAGITYVFRLARIDAAEPVPGAIGLYPPLVNQSGITMPMFSYPGNAPALKEGDRLAWQVLSVLNGEVVSQSEVFAFSVRCNEPTKNPAAQTYPEPLHTINGNYFIVSDSLRFSFSNAWRRTTLRYSISALATQQEDQVKGPPLNLKSGVNKVSIATEDIKGLQDGRTYLLALYQPGDRPVYLRFLYRAKSENNQ